MELYDHQKKFLEWNPNKCLLCWDTGTGKTLASIFWANIKNGDTLFICPKALVANWQRNLDKFCKVKCEVISKEQFKLNLKKLDMYSSIVVDESHYFAGQVSDLSKSLTAYIRYYRVKNVLLLTATPYRSSPWDIYVLARHLGYDWNYIMFQDKFFEEVWIGRGGFTFRTKEQGGTVKGKRVIRMREGIKDDIVKLVAKIGSIVDINECADIPEQVSETEVFEPTKDQIQKKADNYDASPIVRYTRYHEIENGVLVSDGYSPNLTNIECLKNERIRELCLDNHKIIIVCRYNLQIDALKELLKDINDVYVIRGDVKDRDNVVQTVEKADKAIVLIQAACSEGYELPSFPLMVFASMDYSYVNYKQMRGRILRLNKLKKNVYLHLVTKGIDTAVYNAIMKKQDFSLAIYANNKNNPEEEEIYGEEFSN